MGMSWLLRLWSEKLSTCGPVWCPAVASAYAKSHLRLWTCPDLWEEYSWGSLVVNLPSEERALLPVRSAPTSAFCLLWLKDQIQTPTAWWEGNPICSEGDALYFISIAAFIETPPQMFLVMGGKWTSCCQMHMNWYKKWSNPWGSCFWFIYNNLISCIYLIPQKINSRSKSFMHLWGSSGLKWWPTRCCLCLGRWWSHFLLWSLQCLSFTLP